MMMMQRKTKRRIYNNGYAVEMRTAAAVVVAVEEETIDKVTARNCSIKTECWNTRERKREKANHPVQQRRFNGTCAIFMENRAKRRGTGVRFVHR